MLSSMSVSQKSYLQVSCCGKKENIKEKELVPQLPLPSRLIRSRGNICRCWFCRVNFFQPDSPHLRFGDEPLEPLDGGEEEEVQDECIYEEDLSPTDDKTDFLQRAVLCQACIARLQADAEDDAEEGEWDEVGEDEI